MPACIAIKDAGHTVGEIREKTRKCKDAKQSRRLGAVALAMEGVLGRAEIATLSLADLVRLGGPVKRGRPRGLKDRPRSGGPRLLSREQRAEVGRWLEEGPEPGTPS